MFDVILFLGILFMLVITQFYRNKYISILGQKKSSEVRLGQITEHIVPFLRQFKYNPKTTHFIGMPVDYIAFEPDKIVFIEVKTGTSRLSNTQQQIKQLIVEGKVVWEELRIDTTPITAPERETAMTAVKKAGIEVRM
jgi:predicted Holliday junction resolvase-like endonuclease